MKKRDLLFALSFLLLGAVILAQELKPGVARWNIKVSVLSGSASKTPKPLTVKQFKGLDAPAFDPKDYKTKRMRSPNEPGLQEGDIVKVEHAWVQLVALEKSSKGVDGDYHIQINEDRTDRDECVIVEVPFEDFAPNQTLGKKYATVRSTIRDKFFGGKEPSSSAKGACLKHPVEVTLTGQLFYDATHKASPDKPGGGRGKGGCNQNAATIWEIHPVLTMTITSKKGQPEVPCQ
ncbi:MAG: hypothetical protein HYX26_01960 [Acidobacteriales bacterium]|nr:hypothetical protein [Terriglobales bacterium]